MEDFGSEIHLLIPLSGPVGGLGDSFASVSSIWSKPKDLKLIILFRLCRCKTILKDKEGENRRDSYFAVIKY